MFIPVDQEYLLLGFCVHNIMGGILISGVVMNTIANLWINWYFVLCLIAK